MRSSKFTEEQISFALKQAETGTSDILLELYFDNLEIFYYYEHDLP